MGDISVFLKKPQVESIEKIEIEKDISFSSIEHIVILFPLTETTEILIDEQNIFMTNCQVLIAQKGVSYSLKNHYGKIQTILKICIGDIHVSGHEKNRFLEAPYVILDLAEDSQFVINNCLYLERAYRENINFAQHEILETILSTLFLLFLNKIKEHVNEVSDITQTTKKYIEKNYRQDISLTMLAEKLNFSVYYLSHIFKKEMGCAPMQYLMNVRMEKAKELLQGTNNTILFVAQQVGYSNPNYFNMLFKRVIGITPGQFRRKSRKVFN